MGWDTATGIVCATGVPFSHLGEQHRTSAASALLVQFLHWKQCDLAVARDKCAYGLKDSFLSKSFHFLL
jgi:hypothetical protein